MMKASDIMTQNVVMIHSFATVAEAIQVMQTGGWRSLIVEREHEDDAYGIITETDVACKVLALNKDPAMVRVHEVMTKPCIVVNPDLSVENVLRLFTNSRLLSAPVIQGELLGIISISDILVKSHLGEQIHPKLGDRDLQDLVQQARAAYTTSAFQPTPHPSHISLEDRLTELSQQSADNALKAALEAYLTEREELTENAFLDNFCSG
ncbi:CBS domain-containing protein [Leptolyngbya sp. AN02str]|uniref:CBS domain-containing protein n=1 Tax=Leptolyngbya sp. AN02str TaxID=3423363 RepID=UPI003D310DD0